MISRTQSWVVVGVMKKIKPAKKLILTADVLRTLQASELGYVDGGVTDSALLKCVNQLTAASTGRICCA
jgi:hypothetical protein